MKPLARSTSKGGEAVLFKALYKSGLEQNIASQLKEAGVDFEYETKRLKFTIPARTATYTPDFHIGNMVIEAKGYFRKASDRQKLVLVKQAYPDMDLRLVFQKASNPIYKGSSTTYAKWAEDHGFKWADGGRIPDEWLEEVKDEQSRSGA